MRARHGAEERTIPALLRAHAERRPDHAFLVDEAGELSWSRALETVRATSAAFAALGIKRGDTVGIMLDNRRELVMSWLGAVWLAAVEVPLDPDTRGDRLVHALNKGACRELVVGADSLPQVEAVADRLTDLKRVIVVGDGSSERFESVPFDELEADAGRAPDTAVRFSDPAAVMFTSGSTGPAKGAVISHGQHYTNGWQPTSLFDIEEDDRLYVCLPLHHNMAQGYGVCVAMVSGASVRIAPRFDAARFWDDVRGHDASILSFVGAMLVLLAKRPPADEDRDNPLRVGFGVPIPAELHEGFERRFGMRLVHAYGSTEATIVAWNHREDRKIGAAGRPLPDFEVEIHDQDDFALPAGGVGEICVRSKEPFSMFSGYWRDPERTVAAWHNLWFHTGDRGWIDDDGDLWFSDRLDDVVRRMGEFISPQEVEQVVIAHPDVALAAAYGVPSELSEEELMVAVVVQAGTDLDAADVRMWCAARLPRKSVPRFVELLEELPMTPTGKIEKYKLRDRGVTSSTDDARGLEEVAR